MAAATYSSSNARHFRDETTWLWLFFKRCCPNQWRKAAIGRLSSADAPCWAEGRRDATMSRPGLSSFLYNEPAATDNVLRGAPESRRSNCLVLRRGLVLITAHRRHRRSMGDHTATPQQGRPHATSRPLWRAGGGGGRWEGGGAEFPPQQQRNGSSSKVVPHDENNNDDDHHYYHSVSLLRAAKEPSLPNRFRLKVMWPWPWRQMDAPVVGKRRSYSQLLAASDSAP